MNERIKDLLPNPFAVDYQYKDGPLDLYTEKEMIRFAELIIRECIQQCLNVEEDGELYKEPGTFADGALLCREEIKAHFGVKE